jgi:hypothetical protein
VREAKTHINVRTLTYKATITGIEIDKYPPRHIGKESESDKTHINL